MQMQKVVGDGLTSRCDSVFEQKDTLCYARLVVVVHVPAHGIVCTRIILPFALPTGRPWWPMSDQLQRNAAIMLFFFFEIDHALNWEGLVAVWIVKAKDASYP
jgi:hypothetical protein